MDQEERFINSQPEELIMGQGVAEILLPAQETGREFTPEATPEEATARRVPSTAAFSVVIDTVYNRNEPERLALPRIYNHNFEGEVEDENGILTIKQTTPGAEIKLEIDRRKLSGTTESSVKLIEYIFSKIYEQALIQGELAKSSSVSLRLDEIAGENKIFGSTKQARRACLAVRDFLTSVKIQGTVRPGQHGEIKSDTLQVLATGGDINNSLFWLDLNPKAGWRFLAGQSVPLPIYFLVLTPRAAKLLIEVFNFAARNVKAQNINKDGTITFKMSLRFLQQKLGLPFEARYIPIFKCGESGFCYEDHTTKKYRELSKTKIEDEEGNAYKIVKTRPFKTELVEDEEALFFIEERNRKPKEKIREPLETAVDEIEIRHNALFKNGNIRFNYPDINGKHAEEVESIEEYLNEGCLEVTLGGFWAQNFSLRLEQKGQKMLENIGNARERKKKKK